MRIAIIPARKGSERAPGKNTAIVGGLSLIERAIQQALRVSLYDTIIVSTDSETIMDSMSKYPVTIVDRRPTLATANAPLIAVIADLLTVNQLPASTDVALLLVTNPLRNDSDIIEAHERFDTSDRSSTLVSVCVVDYPIEMTWRLGVDGLLHSSSHLTTTRKQDFQLSYRFNDAIVIDTSRNFLTEGRTLFGTTPLPFKMPPERSLCIDYPWQLELTRRILEGTGDGQ